jgi:type III secretion protein J
MTSARAALALATCLVLAGCKVGLYSNLTEQEANEMLAALSTQSVAASKEAVENGWQLQVEEGDLGTALELLRAHGLPHDRFVSMGDVFQKQGLVSTPAEERMRYIYALSQELSQTLSQIDGVVSARVHVVVPANDPLSDKIRPSSAAVFIKHQPDVDLRLLVPAVKDMVAHSIEGLTHEQVSLTLFPAREGALRAAPARARADGTVPWPALPSGTRALLLALLAAAAAALAALPFLLKRRGLAFGDWLRQWNRAR